MGHMLANRRLKAGRVVLLVLAAADAKLPFDRDTDHLHEDCRAPDYCNAANFEYKICKLRLRGRPGVSQEYTCPEGQFCEEDAKWVVQVEMACVDVFKRSRELLKDSWLSWIVSTPPYEVSVGLVHTSSGSKPFQNITPLLEPGRLPKQMLVAAKVLV